MPRSFVSCTKEWFRPIIPNECKVNDFKVSKAEISDHINPLREALKKLAYKHNNLYVYDVFEDLCPEKVCKTVNNGLQIFRDTDHLSNKGALALKNSFVEFLSSNNLI